MRRIADTHPVYELHGARVQVARVSRECCAGSKRLGKWIPCDQPIAVGHEYALTSTKLAFCRKHYSPADVIEVTPAEARRLFPPSITPESV